MGPLAPVVLAVFGVGAFVVAAVLLVALVILFALGAAWVLALGDRRECAKRPAGERDFDDGW